MGNLCFSQECQFSCEINFIFYKKLNVSELISVIEAQEELYLAIEFLNDSEDWKIADFLNQLLLCLRQRNQKPKFIEIQFPRKHILAQEVYKKIFDFFLEGYSLKLEFLGISMAMYSQKDFKIHIEATIPEIALMISRAVSDICVFDIVQFSTYSCLLFYEEGENKKLEININRRSNDILKSFIKGFCGHEYKKLQFFLKITTKKTFGLNIATFKQFLMKNKVYALEIKFDVNGEDVEGTLHFSKLLYSTDISVAKRLILNFSRISMRPKSHKFIFECLSYVKNIADIEVLMNHCSIEDKNELEIACGISKLCGLRKLSLNLANNNLCISPKTIHFLGSIKSLSTINLDFSANSLSSTFNTAKGFNELIAASNNKKEITLNFSLCRMPGEKLLELSKHIGILIDNAKCLEKLKLILYSVTLEKEFSSIDFSMVKRELNLKELYLSLSENSLDAGSLVQLAHLFERTPNLTTLSLSLNFALKEINPKDNLKNLLFLLKSLTKLKRLQNFSFDFGSYLPDDFKEAIVLYLLGNLKTLRQFNFGSIETPNLNKINLTKYFNKNILENRKVQFGKLVSMTMACKRNRLFRKLSVRREIKYFICNKLLLSN